MLVGGVCCSHYGLRLIVVRTATLLMRRLLVWCERFSCSSELVVVMVEELWRAARELRSKAWQQTTRHALIGADTYER